MLTEYEIELLLQNKFKMGEAARKIYRESKFRKNQHKKVILWSNMKDANSLINYMASFTFLLTLPDHLLYFQGITSKKVSTTLGVM